MLMFDATCSRTTGALNDILQSEAMTNQSLCRQSVEGKEEKEVAKKLRCGGFAEDEKKRVTRW